MIFNDFSYPCFFFAVVHSVSILYSVTYCFLVLYYCGLCYVLYDVFPLPYVMSQKGTWRTIKWINKICGDAVTELPHHATEPTARKGRYRLSYLSATCGQLEANGEKMAPGEKSRWSLVIRVSAHMYDINGNILYFWIVNRHPEASEWRSGCRCCFDT